MFLQSLSPAPAKRNRVWLLVFLAVLTVLATALVAHASAPGATIKLGSNATLANPPSSVIMSVDYSCQPSAFSFASVNIDQSQPAGVASGSRVDVFGFGSFQPICDGKSHHATVVVTANFGSFTTGNAGASAFVASGAVFASTSTELSIK